MKPEFGKTLIASLSALALFTCDVLAAAAASLEIHFCPASAVYTYPLESRREVNSLLLQNVAVLNRGTAMFKIKTVTLELLAIRKGHRFEAARH